MRVREYNETYKEIIRIIKKRMGGKLSEEELKKLDQFLWDLNTRALNGEKVEFPRFPDDIMYQLGEWRHKRMLERLRREKII